MGLKQTVQTWSAINATPATFNLQGGLYALTLTATWGGGSATLQRKTPSGVFVTCMTAVTADTFATAQLPSGVYQLTIATAAALSGDLVSIAEP